MPPPGFGPKLPKPSAKEAVKAALEAINPADKYAIHMDREEEAVLREVLKAVEEHSEPRAQPLMRDQRRLHQLYGQLHRLGFSEASVEACLPTLRSDASLPDALDWCCLHLPERALPKAFRLTGEGGSDDEEASAPAAAPAAAAKKAPLRRPAPASAQAAPKQAAAPAAASNAAAGNAEEWTRRYAQQLEEGSSEEEEGLADQMGVLELEELGLDRMRELLLEKRAAAAALLAQAEEARAEGEGQGEGEEPQRRSHSRIRRTQRHVAEVRHARAAPPPSCVPLGVDVRACCVHGACMVRACCVHGACMVRAWCLHGACMVRAGRGGARGAAQEGPQVCEQEGQEGGGEHALGGGARGHRRRAPAAEPACCG